MRRASIVSLRSAVAAGSVLVFALGALVVRRSSRALHSAAEDVRAEHEFR